MLGSYINKFPNLINEDLQDTVSKRLLNIIRFLRKKGEKKALKIFAEECGFSTRTIQ